MRILILSSEAWNDRINGNNVVSNWFSGFDAEFANIYMSAGEPYNHCCKKYFQLTETAMLKSITKGILAGRIVEVEDYYSQDHGADAVPTKLYSMLRHVSGPFLRFIREELWLRGKYNMELLKSFIDDFKPDIIFSERMASCKMLRLERTVLNICDVPMFAFTGDDEYSLKRLSFSPLFWFNRFRVRYMLRQMVSEYRIYYTLSYEQKVDYETRFGCKCKLLQKCADMPTEYSPCLVHQPIRMIYAGKFYCNRWKALVEIADILRVINRDEVRIVLEIYTRDLPNKKQKRLLNDGRSSFIKGAVSQEELKEIYKDSDIAIHVESRDIKNRLVTRLSFSTKIIDCIESGCAILAYCWNKHSGWTYLKRENAAVCVSSLSELREGINSLVNHPEIIEEYARRAYECGIRRHRRECIQKMLKDDFEQAIMPLK